MNRGIALLTLFAAELLDSTVRLQARDITLAPGGKLEEAAKDLRPGDQVLIPPGKYPGRQYLNNLHGTPDEPIVIRGTDPKSPPVFQFVGGAEGIHLTHCSYLTVAGVEIENQPGNGMNIDDGKVGDPSHHIYVHDVTIRNTGPKGNHDALKMSGVDYFVVRRLKVENWAGQGIDCVRCHFGVIEDCTFTNTEPYSGNDCITIKGGANDVLIQCNSMQNHGLFLVRIGGQTDLPLIYPADARFEARDVTVAGNRLLGSAGTIGFFTSQGGHVHHNTIVDPTRYVIRILSAQPPEKIVELVPLSSTNPDEKNRFVLTDIGPNPNPRFKSTQGGVFENNIVLFSSKLRFAVNLADGGGIEPGTFKFRNNLWWKTDLKAGAKKPAIINLPTAEENQLLQAVDPQIAPTDPAPLHATSKDSRVSGKGADAYQRTDRQAWYWPAVTPPR